MPKKPSQLESFTEADAALAHLGRAMRELTALELACQAKIDGAKTQLAESRVVVDATIKVTARMLTAFVKTHQAEIEARGGKTIRLTFGRIGMRTPPPSLKLDKGFSEDDVIALLRRYHATDFDALTRTTVKLDRDALKLWDDEALARVGLRIDQDDVVVIEPADDVASAAGEVA